METENILTDEELDLQDQQEYLNSQGQDEDYSGLWVEDVLNLRSTAEPF